MPLYYYDDLSLEMYTTTVVDVSKHTRKNHKAEPLYLDPESMKQSEEVKAESKIIFKS